MTYLDQSSLFFVSKVIVYGSLKRTVKLVMSLNIINLYDFLLQILETSLETLTNNSV